MTPPMPKTFQKINDEGQFCAFPGITIVAAIPAESLNVWKTIYDCINEDQTIRRYYTPLPYTSYHMTAINLYTEHHHDADDWEDFITKEMPFFQQLQADFASKALQPQITIDALTMSGAIQLRLKLPPEQEIMIREIAHHHGVEAGIPPKFHITLAYQYQSISPQEASLIKNKLNDKLKAWFNPQQPVITLDSPQLCYFNDMTQFIPWHGDTYPFKSKQPTPTFSSRFFSQQKSTTPSSEETCTICAIS